MVLSLTKSDKPRTIALDDESARRWREAFELAAAAHMADFGSDLPHDTFVFARDHTGLRPVRPDSLTKQWRRACNQANVNGVEFEMSATGMPPRSTLTSTTRLSPSDDDSGTPKPARQPRSLSATSRLSESATGGWQRT